MKNEKSSVKKRNTINDVYTDELVDLNNAIQGRDGLFNKEDVLITGKSPNGHPLSCNNPHVVLDEYGTKAEPVHIDKREALKIVTKFDEQTETNIYGYTIEEDRPIRIVQNNHPFEKYIYVKLFDMTEKLGLKESLFDGLFYKPGSFKPSLRPIKYKRFDFPNIKDTVQDNFRFGKISPSYRISEGHKYTFGLELETSAGFVPSYVRKDLNMMCVYDGSIRDERGNKGHGGEYVTGVLKGDNGFRHLYKMVSELSKRCDINNTCSVHVHIGDFIFNKEQVVMLWKINQLLEAELYSMMPASRKIRDHCKAMTQIKMNFDNRMSYKMNIDAIYNKIHQIVALGKSPSRNVNKRFSHPAGKRCGWDTNTPRYWWVNFVPAIFNLKGPENYTIEFRMHSATLNFTKIKNWILICMGIVNVAENHRQKLIAADSLTLAEVMRLAYPGKADYLINYIEERKALFSEKLLGRVSENSEYSVVRPEKSNSDKKFMETLWD